MTHPEDRTLELAGGTIPTARSIRAELKDQLNRAILVERERRGKVALPEDTYPMHRALLRVIETCGEYSRAFSDTVKEAKAVAQEELADVVGESDGVPNQGMTVPDAEGDVIISLDTARVHEFDRDALFAAVAFEVLESMDVHNELLEGVLEGACQLDDESPEDVAVHERLDNFLAGLLTLAMQRLTECGKFEPQVTKVKAFAANMSRHGGDSVAATVTSSHYVREVFKGVKVERKVDTKPKARK